MRRVQVRVECAGSYRDGHRTRACRRLLHTWSPHEPLAEVPVSFDCGRCGATHRPPPKRFRDALTHALAFGPSKVELPLPAGSPRYINDTARAERPEYRRDGPAMNLTELRERFSL